MFNVLVDSGTIINIFQILKTNTPPPTHKKCNIWIRCQGSHSVLGQFSILLEFRGISCQADMHVIKNPEKPIIGWETCKKLKLLSANTHSVNRISNSDEQTPLSTLKLLEDYADLFNGLGKLKEKKFTNI